MTHSELSLPSDASAPSLARGMLAEVLGDRAGSEGLSRGQLALSEVVSNAVRHGGAEGPDSIQVVIHCSDDTLSVTVIQPGPVGDRPSIVAMPDPWSTSGYGLVIVDAVADQWGVHVDPPSVWFEMRL